MAEVRSSRLVQGYRRDITSVRAEKRAAAHASANPYTVKFLTKAGKPSKTARPDAYDQKPTRKAAIRRVRELEKMNPGSKAAVTLGDRVMKAPDKKLRVTAQRAVRVGMRPEPMRSPKVPAPPKPVASTPKLKPPAVAQSPRSASFSQQKSGYKGRMRSTWQQRALGSSVAATAKSARWATNEAAARLAKAERVYERLASAMPNSLLTGPHWDAVAKKEKIDAYNKLLKAQQDHAEKKAGYSSAKRNLGQARKALGKTGQGGRLAVRGAGMRAPSAGLVLTGKKGGKYVIGAGGTKLYIRKK